MKSIERVVRMAVRRLSVVVFVFVQMPVHAQADICSRTGYTVGFFNGVWNTILTATDSTQLVAGVIGEKYEEESIEYRVFHNETGSENDSTMGQVVAEVFIQRADEIDASGELGRRFEYIWESMSADKPFFTRLARAMGASLSFFEAIYTSVISRVMAAVASMISHPPLQETYAKHRIMLDTLAVERRKILLVAHSQGNLFVNPAYDYVVPKLGASSVAVVHIAPASPTVRGDYVLADIDTVINSLRIQGFTSVPPVNMSLAFSSSDISGHTLANMYLHELRASLAVIKSIIVAKLEELSSPPVEPLNSPQDEKGHRGFFTATLTWDGEGDVDLHALEPNGTHVFYAHKRGPVGELDVDNTSASGPEHYYASCDPNVLEEGVYRIGINNYAGANGRIATVQIDFAQGGQPLIKALDVGGERSYQGAASPIPVTEVTVQKDDDGRFSATAE